MELDPTAYLINVFDFTDEESETQWNDSVLSLVHSTALCCQHASLARQKATSLNPFHYSFLQQNQKSYHHEVNVWSVKSLQMQGTERFVFWALNV